MIIVMTLRRLPQMAVSKGLPLSVVGRERYVVETEYLKDVLLHIGCLTYFMLSHGLDMKFVKVSDNYEVLLHNSYISSSDDSAIFVVYLYSQLTQ